MVAEKPSICNSIAAALAGSLDKCKTSGRSPPIHEFTGSFKGQIVTFRVTSVTGHVFSVDFPAAYQNWESTQPVELFGAPIVRKPTRGSMVKFLKDAGKNIDSLVLWLVILIYSLNLSINCWIPFAGKSIAIDIHIMKVVCRPSIFEEENLCNIFIREFFAA